VAAAADETRIALEAIGREAADRRAERAEAADIRDHVLEIEQEHRLQEIRVIDGRRQAFRDELRQVLDRFGNQAGPHIVELAGKGEIDPPAGADRAFDAEAKKQRGKLDRPRRVELARAHGLPEQAILADLVREQKLLMKSRSGPRSIDEAVVRAARILLAVPLHEPRITAAGPGQQRPDDAQ
jgi:hypothetical protein